MEDKTIEHTLYTFGCSWTYGVGVCYHPKMTMEEYNQQGWIKAICNEKSFRGILADRLQIKNINYSRGGASNDRNFRLLSEILGDKEAKKSFLKSNPIVLFGITSTARIERKYKQEHRDTFLNNNLSTLYFVDDGYEFNTEDVPLFWNDKETLYQALHLKLHYSHPNEVKKLYHNMNLYNEIFDKFDVPVLWYDSVNTLEYPNKIDNFFGGQDLMTALLDYKKIKFRKTKKWYHFSDWLDDDPRITLGINNNLLNPYSMHPTEEGHEIIAQLFYPALSSILSKRTLKSNA